MEDGTLLHNFDDHNWVDPKDQPEMRRDADSFGVTQTELKDAMNHVGHLRDKIALYLENNKNKGMSN